METEVKDVNNNLTANVDESVHSDLKAKQAELMSVISDSKIMKAYRAIRKDVYGVGERHQVSQKEKKKKKAKRRMAKKSKR